MSPNGAAASSQRDTGFGNARPPISSRTAAIGDALSDNATLSSGSLLSRGTSIQPCAVMVPADVARLAPSNRTRRPSGAGMAAKAPASFSPFSGCSSQAGALARTRPVTTSATTPWLLASNCPLAASTETGQACGAMPRPVNRPLARTRSISTRSVTGAEIWRPSITPCGTASSRGFSIGCTAGSPFRAASVTRSSIRANSALTTTAPSRASLGGIHIAAALEGGQVPLDVVTTRSRVASVQPPAVRSTLNEALTSSKPRRFPMWTTPGDCTWIVPSASTGRPPCQVLHTLPETTPASVSVSDGPTSRPRWPILTSWAAR